MICPKCKETGVLNHALGKPFYYCRTCKEEIGLAEPKPKETPKKDDDKAWYFVSSGITPGLVYTPPPPGPYISAKTMHKLQSAMTSRKPTGGLKCPCAEPGCTITYRFDVNTNTYIDSFGDKHVATDLADLWGGLPS